MNEMKSNLISTRSNIGNVHLEVYSTYNVYCIIRSLKKGSALSELMSFNLVIYFSKNIHENKIDFESLPSQF